MKTHLEYSSRLLSARNSAGVDKQDLDHRNRTTNSDQSYQRAGRPDYVEIRPQLAGLGLQMTESNTQDLLNTALGEFCAEKPVVTLQKNVQSTLTHYVRGKFPWIRNLKIATTQV